MRPSASLCNAQLDRDADVALSRGGWALSLPAFSVIFAIEPRASPSALAEAVPSLGGGNDTNNVLAALRTGSALGPLLPIGSSVFAFGLIFELSIARLALVMILPWACATFAVAIWQYLRTRSDPLVDFNIPVSTLLAFAAIGIYLTLIGSGIATTTEALAIVSTLAVPLWWRSGLRVIALAGHYYLLFLGASIFSMSLAFIRAPQMLSEVLASSGLAPLTILLAITLFIVIVALYVDAVAAIAIAVLPLFPTALGLGSQ